MDKLLKFTVSVKWTTLLALMYNGQTKTFALIGLLKYNIYSGNHAYYSYVDTYYYLL